MITILKVFGNLFHNKGISRQHLLGYAKDNLQRFVSANGTHIYNAIIAFLNPLITTFSDEISNEDTNINIRLGKTKTVEMVTADFVKTMGERKGGISRTFGGENSEGYLEFYPKGQKEYNNPTREDMALYVKRVGKASLKYATELGTEISTELQAFEPAFNAARGSQVAKIGDIATDKTAISSNQLALELGLTKVVHEVGAMYPGDIATCNSLFNFNLLYSVAHHLHTLFTDDILPTAEATVVNQSLSDTMQIIAKNTSTNADYYIWLGAIPFDPVHGTAILVKAGKSINLKASDIGDLTSTFLTIKNASSINSVGYEVTIIG